METPLDTFDSHRKPPKKPYRFLYFALFQVQIFNYFKQYVRTFILLHDNFLCKPKPFYFDL